MAVRMEARACGRMGVAWGIWRGWWWMGYVCEKRGGMVVGGQGRVAGYGSAVRLPDGSLGRIVSTRIPMSKSRMAFTSVLWPMVDVTSIQFPASGLLQPSLYGRRLFADFCIGHSLRCSSVTLQRLKWLIVCSLPRECD